MDFSNWIFWIVLILILIGIYFISDAARKTVLAQKGMEKLNQTFSKIEKDLKEIDEKMKDIPKTEKIDRRMLKLFKKLQDRFPEQK